MTVQSLKTIAFCLVKFLCNPSQNKIKNVGYSVHVPCIQSISRLIQLTYYSMRNNLD